MTPKNVKLFFERLQEQNANPTTELIFNSPFELLIAVMLSAQATDVGVNKATKVLFKVANTPKNILALGEEKLKEYVKTINFFNTKAKNIIKTCQILIDKHHGKVPGDRESLEELPGVGRKTANVVLNTAFGESTMAVDTHIFRVANRTQLAPGKTPLEVEHKLLKVVPTIFMKNAHHWLILHGRYTCVARKPKCYACIVEDLCPFEPKAEV